MTSEKKKDIMLSYTNQADGSGIGPGGTTYTVGPAILNGTGGTGTPYTFAWLPSARTPPTGNVTMDVNFEDIRSRTTCYIRGLKEVVSLATNSGASWKWRRIVVAWKDVLALNPAAGFQDSLYVGTPGTGGALGYVRVLNSLNDSRYTELTYLLFRGAVNKDWSDPFTAPVDRTRLTVLYDVTKSISSNNDTGIDRVYRRWHPVNHNLVYDDDQNGGGINYSNYSSVAKSSIGDIVVIDMLRGGPNSGSGDRLRFQPEATWYWHER